MYDEINSSCSLRGCLSARKREPFSTRPFGSQVSHQIVKGISSHTLADAWGIKTAEYKAFSSPGPFVGGTLDCSSFLKRLSCKSLAASPALSRYDQICASMPSRTGLSQRAFPGVRAFAGTPSYYGFLPGQRRLKSRHSKYSKLLQVPDNMPLEWLARCD